MKTQNLVSELKKYGIRAANYKRPPTGGDVFALTILPKHKEGVVTVNQGQARVQVYGNKKMRQAAVTVNEPPRVVTKKMSVVIHSKEKPKKHHVLGRMKDSFPVIMPSGTRWSLTNLTLKLRPFTDADRNENKSRGFYGLSERPPKWDAAGEVTATVGKLTVHHFLIGIDETRNFIAPLSRKATSVMMAHRMLKPVKEMRRSALRQGEWFFIPATRDMVRTLEKIATDQSRRLKTIRLGSTTHTAQTAVSIPGAKLRGKKRLKGMRRGIRRSPATIYARGYITDSRKGHHRSLFLPKWTKVVRNKEAVIKVSPQQRKAVRRRRATWD